MIISHTSLYFPFQINPFTSRKNDHRMATGYAYARDTGFSTASQRDVSEKLEYSLETHVYQTIPIEESNK
jgi:hypothetical protein